jgi:aryl carrier-like protein
MIMFFPFLGEPFTIKLFHLIISIGMQGCRIWNLYGPAESTIDCVYHFVDITTMMESIPIGIPLPNYRCIIKDNFSQNVIINQEAELYVGGVGVFAGYLGRDDLTEKALIEIDGEIFYLTGDLVRMDNNGLLDYQGRKDYQIKLHGQRIELAEIERCLLNTSISACVVIKWGDDHLVAYVQTSDMNEEQLRKHCQSHLPPHMIPSIFIVLDKLPLNANGKIDRKSLPPPSFSHLASTSLTNQCELLTPRNEIEVTIHHIWCNIFQQNQISIDTNIFAIGGHSLLLMQLFHRYKTQFHLQTNTVSIADLFQHPTIIGHSELIHQAIDNTQNIDNLTWSSLNLIQGKSRLSIIVINRFLSFRCSSSIICSRKNLFR